MRKLMSGILVWTIMLSCLGILPVYATGTVQINQDRYSSTPPAFSTDVPEFTESASWGNSSVAPSPDFGTPGSLNTGVVGSWAQWTPGLNALTPGVYKVYFYNVRRTDASKGWDTNLQIDVVNKFQGQLTTNTFYINQQTASGSGSDWVQIGSEFWFSGTGDEYAKATRIVTTSGYTQVKSFKFVPVPVPDHVDNGLAVSFFGVQNGGIDQEALSSGTFKGNMRFYNISQAPGPMILVLAKYRKDTGELADIKFSQSVVMTASDGFNNISTDSINLGEDYNQYKVQLMLLDSITNIRPLITKKTIE